MASLKKLCQTQVVFKGNYYHIQPISPISNLTLNSYQISLKYMESQNLKKQDFLEILLESSNIQSISYSRNLPITIMKIKIHGIALLKLIHLVHNNLHKDLIVCFQKILQLKSKLLCNLMILWVVLTPSLKRLLLTRSIYL